MSKRRKFYFFSLFFYLLTYNVCMSGQQMFDILPNVGGVDSQAQAWTLLPDLDIFFVVGDRLDTTLNNGIPTVFPWIGTLNYNGDMLNLRLIKDDDFVHPLRVTRNF